MNDDRDRVAECTTPAYSGIVSVLDPKSSWCAKWMRLNKAVPGCYALEINDDVPDGIAGEIEEHMERGRRGRTTRGTTGRTSWHRTRHRLRVIIN